MAPNYSTSILSLTLSESILFNSRSVQKLKTLHINSSSFGERSLRFDINELVSSYTNTPVPSQVECSSAMRALYISE